MFRFSSLSNFAASLLNLVCLSTLFILVHAALCYYFDVALDAQKAWWEAGTTGAVLLIYGLLSDKAKSEIAGKIILVLQSSATFSLSLIACLALFLHMLFLERTIIVWPTGEGTILVGKEEISTQAKISHQANETSVYGLPFSTLPIVVGEYRDTIIFRPFSPYRYDVPESAIYSSSLKYKEITTLLALSFYQYVEAKMLADAKADFDADDARHFVDLNLVYNILDLCFVKIDISRSGETLLKRYISAYPSSAWIELLKSCQFYSHRNYTEAAKILERESQAIESPLKETYVFFRAVNHLREFIEASNTKGQNNQTELIAAHRDFAVTIDQLSADKITHFQKIALPTARIFDGIAYVYQHRLTDAHNAFFSAAKSTDYPELKARALSDDGYVQLLLGNLNGGEALFASALEANLEFPYARTNLGYALLAEGKYAQARKKFQELVEDKKLAQTSHRDVVLAEIAIAHIDNETKGADPAVYDEAMKEIGLYNYANISEASLRLAHIHLALANQIYLNPTYYGLEILALAMLARAYFEADAIAGNNDAEALKSQAFEAFIKVRRTVDERCFIFHIDHGFFKQVADLSRKSH